MLFLSVTSALAQVSIGIGFPGMSIGFNLPMYPELVRMPGYPVYYAPGLNSNFFFYDGMYWVYERDTWYASSWYNGPWDFIAPEAVPLFVLRIPVRYYRDPPEYFRGWRSDAPPRWGQHWGRGWEQHRSGWDRWDRKSAPAPAPLPVYQRKYSGDRYPQAERQRELHSQNYRYQPRDAAVRQNRQERSVQGTPVPSRQRQQEAPQERSPRAQEIQHPAPPQPDRQSAPAIQRSAPTQQRGEEVPRPAPPHSAAQQREPAVHDQVRPPAPGTARHEQQVPDSVQDNTERGKGAMPEPRRGQGQEKERAPGEGRGQERNK